MAATIKLVVETVTYNVNTEMILVSKPMFLRSRKSMEETEGCYNVCLLVYGQPY